MKRLISFFIIVMMLASAVVISSAAEPIRMIDVDYNSDLGKSIHKLVKAGVISGYPEVDSTFTYRSYNPITRAEFCKMINITFGYKEEAENIFSDVSNTDWFYSDIRKAVKQGYIKGHGDGRFAPNDTITREQACVIIDRIVGKTSDKEITISDAVSSWAEKAVKNMIGLGYMNLEKENTFRATAYLTRGEHALLLDDFVVDPDDADSKKPTTGTGSTGGSSTGGSSTGSKPSTGTSGNTSNDNTTEEDLFVPDDGGSEDAGNGENNNEDNGSTEQTPVVDEKVEAVITEISAIASADDITLDDEEAVIAARQAYNLLTGAQRAKVTNYAQLQAAESKIKVCKVIDAISQIPDGINPEEDEGTVNAAKKKFDALSDEQKAQVTNADVLESAIEQITQYKEETSGEMYDSFESIIWDIEDKIAEEVLTIQIGDDGKYILYDTDGNEVKGGPVIQIVQGVADEILSRRDEGELISNYYIRNTYNEQIGEITSILDDMTFEEREAFKFELGKLNTGVLMKLVELFNINIDYGM